jgi:Tol biopolymer transport system component
VYEQDGRLVIQNLATGECVNLTNPEGQRDNFPRWSPKGDWISFTGNREADREYRIYLIRPDGSGLHKLTDSPGDAHASWSPDGNEIIFSSARMGFKDERAVGLDHQPYGEIFTIRADGTGLRQLTDNHADSRFDLEVPTASKSSNKSPELSARAAARTSAASWAGVSLMKMMVLGFMMLVSWLLHCQKWNLLR